MTVQELYDTLKERFLDVLQQHGIADDTVDVTCRALSSEEAIGNTARRDFPILAGKDVMIQAEYRGAKGQAFTDAPSAFRGTLRQVLEMDIVGDAHARGLFVAVMNAVLCSIGLCEGTVHCRTDGPELCARDMLAFLRRNYPQVRNIALIGYQPALLQMLSESEYQVRVLDLNPDNIGQTRYGVTVEDGAAVRDDVIANYAELILCTGSTLCNGTVVDYLDIGPETLFFGITMAGAAVLLGAKRVCFAEKLA